MAINNTEKTFSNMEFPLAMKRQDAFALDPTSVWASLEEAQNYAKTNPTAYVGQVMAVVEAGASTVYQIKNTAGDLEPLGAAGLNVATDQEAEEAITEGLSGAETV